MANHVTPGRRHAIISHRLLTSRSRPSSPKDGIDRVPPVGLGDDYKTGDRCCGLTDSPGDTWAKVSSQLFLLSASLSLSTRFIAHRHVLVPLLAPSVWRKSPRWDFVQLSPTGGTWVIHWQFSVENSLVRQIEKHTNFIFFFLIKEKQ